jgi:hypothetical protein
VLKRSQLETWFPDDELLTVPVAALPQGLTDEPARRVLAEVGVPESFLEVMELDSNITQRFETVAEVYRHYDEEPPAGVDGLFYLGFAGQPFLALHGGTGAVLQVHRSFGARPLATSLEAFLRVLGSVSDEVRKYQRGRKPDAGKFTAGLTRDTIKQLGRTDPAALPDAEPAWRDFLRDIAANAS